MFIYKLNRGYIMYCNFLPGKVAVLQKNSGLPTANHFIWVYRDSDPIRGVNSNYIKKNENVLFAEGLVFVS